MSSLFQENALVPSASSDFNDQQWATQIRRTIEEELQQETKNVDGPTVTIYTVPKSVTLTSQDSYIPQQVAIGPYHHLRPELIEMEKYKIAAAKRTLKQLQDDNKLEPLVSRLMEDDLLIRACYDRPLRFGPEALAWMMVVDASFLIEFLGESRQRKARRRSARPPTPSSRLSQLVDKKTVQYNAFLRDIVMEENQIPLFVVRLLLKFKVSSQEMADQMLFSMLFQVSKELSPYNMVRGLNYKLIEVEDCAHVLHFLHRFIALKADDPGREIIENVQEEAVGSEVQQTDDDQLGNNRNEDGDPTNGDQGRLTSGQDDIIAEDDDGTRNEDKGGDLEQGDGTMDDEVREQSKEGGVENLATNIPPMKRPIFRRLRKITILPKLRQGSRHVTKTMFRVGRLLWKIVKFPLKQFLKDDQDAVGGSSRKRKKDDEDDHDDNDKEEEDDGEGYGEGEEKDQEQGMKDNNNPSDMPEENTSIPSATQLVRAGVKLSPNNEGINSIRFDEETQTLHMPTAHVDMNSQVVLRNLAAYEACDGSLPLVVSRYTELMNGIVLTPADAKLLCERGLIVNNVKNQKVMANMWNGMGNSTGLTKVPPWDNKVRGGVNSFYKKRWKVKMGKVMKSYVFDSWRILTFLAASMLLVMTTLQSFCQVHSCGQTIGIKGLERLLDNGRGMPTPVQTPQPPPRPMDGQGILSPMPSPSIDNGGRFPRRSPPPKPSKKPRNGEGMPRSKAAPPPKMRWRPRNGDQGIPKSKPGFAPSPPTKPCRGEPCGNRPGTPRGSPLSSPPPKTSMGTIMDGPSPSPKTC